MRETGVPPARVLVVDEQRGPRESLRMILAPRHAVRVAASSAQALTILRTRPVEVVILDLRQPDARGVGLLQALRSEFPDVEVVVTSGHASFELAAAGIRCGVAGYLVKPFDVREARSAVEQALARRWGRACRARQDGAVGSRCAAEALERLAEAGEAREGCLRGHGRRVAWYADRLAERVGLDARARERLRLAARVHDVGKLGGSAELLSRPGPLGTEERDELRRHPELGALLLESFEAPPDVVGAVRHHHERWDGLGYPEGLCEAEIPLGARLIQLADAFDAMVSERSYCAAQSRAWAVAELDRCAGSQFDPALAKEFVWMLESEADDGDWALVAGALALGERVEESAAPST